MRKPLFFLASLTALALSGCGNGDRDALMAAFGEAGFNEATSDCMVDRAQADMDPELYEAMVEAAKSNNDDLDSLSAAQQLEFAGFLTLVGAQCVGTSLE